jgi:tetratricopeptide (TPR) repeat protein
MAMMGFAPSKNSAAKVARVSTCRVVAAVAAAMALGSATPVRALDPPPSLERTPDDQAEIGARLDKLFHDLPDANTRAAEEIQREISTILSSHGSPTLDLILERGRAALTEGDTATAIEHFSRLIDLAPDFAEAWNMRATAYYLENRLGDSVADIAHVLTLEPRHFGALWGLGLILQRIGSDEKALKAFRAAVALNPHLTDADETIRRLAAKVEGFDI